MVGKYGKAVVVKSLDPTFEKFAVIRPFCGTVWLDTEAEAESACVKYNSVEIPEVSSVPARTESEPASE